MEMPTRCPLALLSLSLWLLPTDEVAPKETPSSRLYVHTAPLMRQRAHGVLVSHDTFRCEHASQESRFLPCLNVGKLTSLP